MAPVRWSAVERSAGGADPLLAAFTGAMVAPGGQRGPRSGFDGPLYAAGVIRPSIMGVLNVTPDSFSDGGRFSSAADAVACGRQMFDDGAAFVDVGGESTRPGAAPVPPDEELRRVLPVVEALVGCGPVSIDTRHEVVARAAVAAGATVINDVSSSLGEVAADLGVGWVAMHMAGLPATMQDAPHYRDVVSEVLDFVLERAEAARLAGVARVWIDPGFGFGKTVDHNLTLLAALDRFVSTGLPVLVGLSRKQTMGQLTLSSDRRVNQAVESIEPADRLEASLAAATWAMEMGVSMVRAHDVRPHVHAAQVVAGSIQQNAMTGAA